MGLRLIASPSVEPVSVSEVKEALRVDHGDDDAMLAGHVPSAREFVERRTQWYLSTQTWEFVIDAFPTNEIAIPIRPVQSITSIKYDDVNGNEQTISAGSYALDNANTNMWVFPIDPWPTAMDTFNSVRVRFVTGYLDPLLIPPSLRAAIILKVKELYDGENTAEAVHNLLTNHYSLVA